ncbi:flavocytochrome c [Solobacterium sp.]|uniref:flavocytochrome c n=1 Tax=Solobacterium sp. TaxID=2060878 RepID=UPI001CAB1F19|nr:flavocytochrome c [Solobacterium sp.]MBF1099057.1 flavocytochrome c [Solobacterium sp.]
MKKLTALLASATMALSLVGCSTGKTYTGEAFGHDKENPVKVTLTIKDKTITKVEVDASHETNGIGSKAAETMPGAIVAANSLEVDGVSGATQTSKAIIEAATAALKQAGLEPSDLVSKNTSTTKAKDIEETVDVVVVGAGGAGMTAAITATDAGKKVIVVESQPIAGGNSVRSTGGMNAAKTPYQDKNEFKEAAGVEKTLATAAEKFADNAIITALAATVKSQWDAYQANPQGYFDSVELMELDTMIGGKGKNNPELVKALAENSADAIEWLASIGAEVKNVGAFGGASVKRIHRPVNADGKVTAVGAYIVPILEKNLQDRNVQFLFDTTANEIIMKDGKAVGIKGTGKDGHKVTINAKSVVIATGGFGANAEMVEKYKPELKGFATTNAEGAQGQGIDMATAVGAATVDMDQIQIHPTVHIEEDGNAHLITEGLRGDGAILVNTEGKRFYDEVSTRDKVSAAIIAQPEKSAWLIVDQAMVDKSAVIAGYIKSGYTVTGATYEELAKAMGVDEATFTSTINTWNQAVEAKSDAEFGRTSFANPLTAAPYYAIKITPAVHHTMGGIVINPKAEVLNEKGEAISGLYAAGEVTGGVHGANRLGGNAVADFVVFGRISGQSAADNAK